MSWLLLCLTAAASAQTNSPSAIRTLSLRQCLDLALRCNLDVQIQRLTNEIAGYAIRGSYGVYEPVFSFSARRDFIDQPAEFDPKKTSPDLAYELTTDSGGPTLIGRVPYGLSYDFHSLLANNAAVTDFNSNTNFALLFPGGFRYTNNYTATAGVTLQQHLLRDFWIDADWQHVLVRRKDLKISQEALRFQMMQTLLAVEVSYYDLLAARENIRVQEKALQLKQQFVAETRRRVQVGDLPPLDADQAESQLQTTLTALAAARELFMSQQNVLKSLISDNFRDWVDVSVEPVGGLSALPARVDRGESFANAIKNRPDLAEARLAVEKSAVVVRYRLNQLLPNLDLVGSYGGIGTDPRLGGSLSTAYQFRNPQYFYGAVVSFPLDNVAERNLYRASKAARQVAELQVKKAEQDVLVQVADWANRVESSFNQVGSSHQARVYAEAALEAENKKLQNGFSTSFVVLQLQEILTSARNLEVVALANYNKALAQLAFAEGTTLDRDRLSIEVK